MNGRRRFFHSTATALTEPCLAVNARSMVKDLAQVQLGSEVMLSGWLQSLRPAGAGRIFAELRDSTGCMQLVLDSGRSQDYDRMKRLLNGCPVESVISVKGRLIERPAKDQQGEDLRRLEVVAARIEVLNEASHLPFNPMQTENLPAEEFRLKHRFVDLRRPEMQANLRTRSELNYFIHGHFHERGFTHLETPLLFKRTPEGAKEYTVPVSGGNDAAGLDNKSPNNTAEHKKQFALPQSPQQFKQMLMAAGFERYYQVARCFRQEDLRADRQPEFTQLDLEMAFVTGTEQVMEPVEAFVKAVMKEFAGQDITEALPRFEYDQAIRTYGSDKPDIRYGFEIVPVAESHDTILEAINLESIHEHLVPKDFSLPVLTEGDLALLKGRFSPDLHNVFAVRRPTRCHAGSTELGKLRNQLIRNIEEAGAQRYYRDDLVPGKGFLWVHSFPLLKPLSGLDSEQGTRRFESMHHPFTSPHPDDLALLESDPLAVRGQHYDLVWNGAEVGGGSLRIHSAALQEKIMRQVIGLSPPQMEQFSHLLDALRSGCPPHGGIALGLDRFLAMLRGTGSIRDVIAFPKNGKGVDLCVNAPN